ncbi:MAG: hypothetical protein AMXMBFR66_04290 [Pseudomonadota bacterium]
MCGGQKLGMDAGPTVSPARAAKGRLSIPPGAIGPVGAPVAACVAVTGTRGAAAGRNRIVHRSVRQHV